MTARILQGDCRDVMKTLPDGSVDAIVTDPPYELTGARPGGRSEATRGKVMGGFMGLAWDATGVANDPATWREALRVLKPGGHLLAFSSTRTYHRMVCAIENAGFEVRDMIPWHYGSGFPKSRNIAEYDMEGEDAERWAGWGTALKPATEPIVVARKPLAKGCTVAANVLQFGTGALNIDGCRIEGVKNVPGSVRRAAQGSAYGDLSKATGDTGGFDPNVGRWPANLIHDGSDEVLAAFPQASGAVAPVKGTEKSAKTANTFGEFAGRTPSDKRDGGRSAARFFYTAKADAADRNEGLPQGQRNTHPTVKPTDLMRYLCRLVTPPGGTVLDPFMGSGSTLKAAELEGFNAIGIELDAAYIDIAKRRVAGDVPLFAEVGE